MCDRKERRVEKGAWCGDRNLVKGTAPSPTFERERESNMLNNDMSSQTGPLQQTGFKLKGSLIQKPMGHQKKTLPGIPKKLDFEPRRHLPSPWTAIPGLGSEKIEPSSRNRGHPRWQVFGNPICDLEAQNQRAPNLQFAHIWGIEKRTMCSNDVSYRVCLKLQKSSWSKPQSWFPRGVTCLSHAPRPRDRQKPEAPPGLAP